MAMEDFRVDIVVGKGPGATRHPALDIAAGHRWSARPRAPGCSPGPLRDRFGFTRHLDFHGWRRSCEVIDQAVGQAAGRADRGTWRPSSSRSGPVAPRGSPTSCSAGVTQKHHAEVRGRRHLTRAPPAPRSGVYEVDELGLDRLDRAVLDGPVHAGSAGDRWGWRRWRSRSARSRRRWRTVGRAVPGPGGAGGAGPRAAGWRPSAAWTHLGLDRRTRRGTAFWGSGRPTPVEEIAPVRADPAGNPTAARNLRRWSCVLERS